LAKISDKPAPAEAAGKATPASRTATSATMARR
jgi:hypothetical protein